MNTHPDPDQFAAELITDDSALTGYLVAEVLNTQPPEVRDVLLSTSILEQVSAQAASELTGNERAAAILSAVARANGFVEPIGSGWYRYHPLFAEVLRLKLRREYPDRLASLHRRAARCYQRSGQLTDAVRHAAQAGDWQFAASIVIDQLAIGEIIEPRGSPSSPGGVPQHAARPVLDRAAAAPGLRRGRVVRWPGLSRHRRAGCRRRHLARPAGQEAASRLAAAMIRLAASRRTGDLAAAAAAAARAEALVDRVPGGNPARHRTIQARVLSGRGAVELWSGHLDAAARTLQAGATAAAAASRQQRAALGIWRWWRRCAAGCAARHSWPPGQQRPPAGEPRPPSRTPAPRRLSPSPGCTWNAMRCPRRTAGSSRPTPPLT